MSNKFPILVVGVVNGNNRIYTKEVIESIVKQSKSKSIYGQIGMPIPWDGNFHMHNVSHKVKNMEVEDDVLYAEIEILDNYNGKRLKEMKGYELRTMGIGDGHYDEEGYFVITSYELSGINAISKDQAIVLNKNGQEKLAFAI